MPYITTKVKVNFENQISWEDVFYNREVTRTGNSDPTRTYTYFIENMNKSKNDKGIAFINDCEEAFSNFINAYKDLYNKPVESKYRTFYIPKSSGGLRRIDAPSDELQTALSTLKNIMENVCGSLYHTSAAAYIKGRSIIDCLKKHQSMNSNFYLKTDLKSFFPNTTLEFVMRQLNNIYPYSEFSIEGKKNLSKAIELGFLNEGLPQGTVLSPFLTNLMMIPIDTHFANYCANKKMVYTRYADDMLISAAESFNKDEMVKFIKKSFEIFETPWKLNEEKTRYGSRAGQNWNLGLMINKDNNITIGHNKKKEFKAMIFNFLTKPETWELEDIQTLNGLVSYYKMVEKDYIEYVIKHTSEKLHKDFYTTMKTYLKCM